MVVSRVQEYKIIEQATSSVIILPRSDKATHRKVSRKLSASLISTLHIHKGGLTHSRHILFSMQSFSTYQYYGTGLPQAASNDFKLVIINVP